MGLLPAKKIRRAFLPHPPARRNANSGEKKLAEVLRILSRKIVSQNRVRIVFVLPFFSLGKSSVLRTEALQRNGCTTLAVLVIWIFFEIHSNFVQ